MDWNARFEERIEAQFHNETNLVKRHYLKLEAWNDVYMTLRTWTEAREPELAWLLGRLCGPRWSNVPDGFFDGPRAWGLVQHWYSHGKSSWIEHSFAHDGQRDEHGIGPTAKLYR